MNEAIKRLMNNKRAFGLMDQDLQDKAREIGQPEFKMYMKNAKWVECGDVDNFDSTIVIDQTYRLRPDYKEKPEIVECEVFTEGNRLRFISPRNENWTLDFALRLPGFSGFKYDGGTISLSPRRFYDGEKGEMLSQIYESDLLVKYEVLTPTHVLFSKKG
jgi:hypothetical protein